MYCSKCGSKLLEDIPTQCSKCKKYTWKNPRCCAGVIITYKEKILMIKRAKEPCKGMWDIPGGYCEPFEHPEDCAKREVWEETNMKLSKLSLFGIWNQPDDQEEYGDNICIYYTSDLLEEADTCQADGIEAEELAWFKYQAIPRNLAFKEHIYQVLESWKKEREKNRQPELLMIDRDGVILKHVEPYILKTEDVEFIDGTLWALRKISELGIKIAIISNQSPISQNLISEDFVIKTNRWIRDKLELNESQLKIYYCPHTDADQCECRKPKPGLLKKAISDFNLSPSHTWMLGDFETDLMAGKALGVEKNILLLSGRQKEESLTADRNYENLLEFVIKEFNLDKT